MRLGQGIGKLQNSAKFLGTSSLPAEPPGNTLKEVHYSVVVVCMITKHKNRLDFVLGLTQIIGIVSYGCIQTKTTKTGPDARSV